MAKSFIVRFDGRSFEVKENQIFLTLLRNTDIEFEKYTFKYQGKILLPEPTELVVKKDNQGQYVLMHGADVVSVLHSTTLDFELVSTLSRNNFIYILFDILFFCF